MGKNIVISERDNIAAIVENSKVTDFFINRGDILLGDVYLAAVENILPSIDAAFVHVGNNKMGFLHASDVPGKGPLQERLTPKQKVLVQVVKEPTGHKGPRVTTSISLPGRFLVLMPDEKGVNISKKIVSGKERARLKSIVSLLKPAGVGVIIRTEAENQTESEIQEDLEFLLDKWNTIVTTVDTVEPPSLVSRDQDLLYRVIREACTEDVDEIIVDTTFALHRTNQLLQSWNMNQNLKVSVHKGMDSILIAKGIDREIKSALQTKVNLPSGGYLFIQQTEALTVVDVNSGRFTSSATQNETIRRTNIESITEIARQLRLRNIGGMIIVDFIDMDNRIDKLTILEEFELALAPDKARPQIGQLSDLGLVELTRHRQGQSLSEIFTRKCPACSGSGMIVEGINFTSSPNETEYAAKSSKIKLPQGKNQRRPGPHGGNDRHANKQQGNRQQGHGQVQGRRIPTSPSVAASSKEQQKPVPKEVELKMHEIKKMTEKQPLNVPVSSAVRLAPTPSGIVNKHLSDNFKKDVFVELSEIDKNEANKENVETNAPKHINRPTLAQQQVRKPNLRQQPLRQARPVEPRVEAPQSPQPQVDNKPKLEENVEKQETKVVVPQGKIEVTKQSIVAPVEVPVQATQIEVTPTEVPAKATQSVAVPKKAPVKRAPRKKVIKPVAKDVDKVEITKSPEVAETPEVAPKEAPKRRGRKPKAATATVEKTVKAEEVVKAEETE